MNDLADRLSEKIHTLSSAQLTEVERFVESLALRDQDSTIAWTTASEPAFEAVWSSPEDDVYNLL